MAYQPRIVGDAVYYSTDLRKYLGISESKLSSWRKAGLKHVPHGRGSFYVGRDVIDFLSQSAVSEAHGPSGNTSRIS